MNKPRFGTNFTIFLLFFGIAVVEAIQTLNWIKIVFWFALALVFLYADVKAKTE